MYVKNDKLILLVLYKTNNGCFSFMQKCRYFHF